MQYAALLTASTLWLTGCGVSATGNIEAMQDQVTPLAQEHASALAQCPRPACDTAITTGTRFIRGYLAGVGQLDE